MRPSTSCCALASQTVPPSSATAVMNETRVVGHAVVEELPVGGPIGRAYGKFEKFNVYKSAEGTQKTGVTRVLFVALGQSEGSVPAHR